MSALSLCTLKSFFFCSIGKRKPAASSTANRRTKFSPLQKMSLEALYKVSKYPLHGVIEEFAKLNNLDRATLKVWFNNKRQRDNYIMENLLKLNFYVLLAEKNKPGNICLHLSCFKFVFLRQIPFYSHEIILMSNG